MAANFCPRKKGHGTRNLTKLGAWVQMKFHPGDICFFLHFSVSAYLDHILNFIIFRPLFLFRAESVTQMTAYFSTFFLFACNAICIVTLCCNFHRKCSFCSRLFWCMPCEKLHFKNQLFHMCFFIEHLPFVFFISREAL